MKRSEYKTGDILAVDRGLYKHYGIYEWDGKVIHYTSDGQSIIKARVCESTVEEFKHNDKVTVENRGARFSGKTIVRRARKDLGSDLGGYNLARNNCEHFARRCETGLHESDQVELVDILFNPIRGAKILMEAIKDL